MKIKLKTLEQILKTEGREISIDSHGWLEHEDSTVVNARMFNLLGTEVEVNECNDDSSYKYKDDRCWFYADWMVEEVIEDEKWYEVTAFCKDSIRPYKPAELCKSKKDFLKRRKESDYYWIDLKEYKRGDE